MPGHVPPPPSPSLPPILTPMDRAMLLLSAAHPPTGHDPASEIPVRPWYQVSSPTPGQLIRRAMSLLNLTQRDMAVRLGIHYVTLNRVVQGLTRTLNPDARWKLEALCQPYPPLKAMYRMVEWSYVPQHYRRRD